MITIFKFKLHKRISILFFCQIQYFLYNNINCMVNWLQSPKFWKENLNKILTEGKSLHLDLWETNVTNNSLFVAQICVSWSVIVPFKRIIVYCIVLLAFEQNFWMSTKNRWHGNGICVWLIYYTSMRMYITRTVACFYSFLVNLR